MNSFLGFITTIFLFKIIEKNKLPIVSKIPPAVICAIVIILILELFKIDFNSYNKSANYLTYFLIPSTIALGYPIYKNIKLLKENKRIIHTSFFLGSTFAIIITYFCSKFLTQNSLIINSMLPKSTTAPIAIEISKNLGAIPELTVCAVVLTGAFGAIFGHKILKLIKVKNDTAIGLAIGSASHIMGTARCVELKNETQIASSSTALVLVGIIIAIIAPIFLKTIEYLEM